MKKYIDGKVCNLSQVSIDNIPIFIKESVTDRRQYNCDDFGNPITVKRKSKNVNQQFNCDDFGNQIIVKSNSKSKIEKNSTSVELNNLSCF